MVVAYVRLFASLGPQPSLPASRIYALLLPSATSCEWDEISIQRSTLGGEGVFPSDAGHIDWCDVGATPVLMPYLGADTVACTTSCTTPTHFARSSRCYKVRSSVSPSASYVPKVVHDSRTLPTDFLQSHRACAGKERAAAPSE